MVVQFPVGRKDLFLKSLLAGICILQLIHIAIVIASDVSPGFLGQKTLLRLFFVGGEANIPAWFESCLFLICSFLLAIISMKKHADENRFWRHWAWLAVVFLLLSLDEIASLHEMTIPVMKKMVGQHELLYYPWVVLGALFVIILTVVYAKFLYDLDTKVRLQFIIAGVVFVLGAMGMEVVEGYRLSISSEPGSYSGWFQCVEETMEMLGLWIFIRALVNYCFFSESSVRLQFS